MSRSEPQPLSSDSLHHVSHGSSRLTPNRIQPPPQPAPDRFRMSWLRILLTFFLIAAGGGFWRWVAPARSTASTAQAPVQPSPRPVEVTRLQPGNGARSVELIGQVESTQQTTIRAQTEGTVQEVRVQPGDRVTAGMQIAILDDADQRLSLAEAEAQLAQARSNLARLEVGTRPEVIAQRQAAVRSATAREQEAMDNLNRISGLVEAGAESQRLLVQSEAALSDAQGVRLAAAAELAEAEAGPIAEEIAAQRANVAAAQAAVRQAQLELQRTRVVAPASGVVQSRLVSAGDYVQSAAEIVSLVAADRLDVFLELPEELSGRIRAGMPIGLNARALPSWQERATITGVVPSADPASRRQRIRVQLNDPPTGLLSGMAIGGQLELPSNVPGFVVSRDALTQRQNQWFVFAVVDNIARPIAIEKLADRGEDVVIRAIAPDNSSDNGSANSESKASDNIPDTPVENVELRAGLPIVQRGGDGLREGAPVKIVEGRDESN
jgi:HlyD family secretion protein